MKYPQINKKIIIFLLIIIVLYFLFQGEINKFFIKNSGLTSPEQMIFKTIDDLLAKTRENILTPPPLRGEENSEQSILIKSEVIRWTNIQRQNNGLAPLKENPKLDLSADNKVQDMFINQYFEHKSPTNVGVDGLTKDAGYEYIIIGENLAMGNFENSEKLVEAWMASPGHRENILNTKYQEIGVAVLKGVYEGEKIWMAVQHFGLPLSYCPKPNENLKTEIDEGEQLVNQLKINLDILRGELESQKPKTKKEIEIYNQKVDGYNIGLSQYNLYVEQIKNLINNYNNQIELFNNCLSDAK
jgi:uncharacterized protein YkwD